MGVLNVTPNSFSDGGRYADVAAALDHARAMVKAGASIIDVGGESTRPGAEPVPLQQELERLQKELESGDFGAADWEAADRRAALRGRAAG